MQSFPMRHEYEVARTIELRAGAQPRRHHGAPFEALLRRITRRPGTPTRCAGDPA
jgi:hypothetical protein